MHVTFLVMGAQRADLPRIREALRVHPSVGDDRLVIHTFARSTPPYLKVACEWSGMWKAARLEADLRVPRHTVILDEAIPVEAEIGNYVADHAGDTGLTQGERAVLTDIETLLKPLGWDERNVSALTETVEILSDPDTMDALREADDERRGNALA